MEERNLAVTATSLVSSAPNLLLRSLKTPARLYRVSQLSPSLVPPVIRSTSWNGRLCKDKEQPAAGASGILAFINAKSGGKEGQAILERIQSIIGKDNAYRLDNGDNDPAKILKARSYDNSGYRIIAGGGDGTSAWIFDALDKANLLDRNAVAVLPLGTGNDMAGFLNWGYTFDRNQDLNQIVEYVSRGKIVQIDRWQITVTNQQPVDKNAQSHLSYDVFNNYLSVGADAVIALNFHNDRNVALEEDAPRTRLQNIFQYLGKYVTRVLESARSGTSLADLIDLECDGINLNARLEYLKPDTLLFLNIRSYSGGCRPWGDANEIASVPYSHKWRKQRADDGLLEVIAYTAVEFSDIALGGRGHRLSQCERVRFRTKTPMAMKVDGEPVLMQPCTIEIKLRNRALGIKKPTSNKTGVGRLVALCGLRQPQDSDTESDVIEF